MARRAVIDRDELFETANAMAAEGKDVTALALLNALGGGSLTTIYKYLSEWEAGRTKTAPSASASEMPDPVKGIFAAAWRTAQTEAARETEAVKQKAAEDVKAAQKKFEEALEGIQKLEAQGEQDAAQIETLKTKMADLEEKLSEARRESAANMAAAEQLRQQVQAQKTEADRLHKTIEEEKQQRHAEAERLRKERETAIKEAAELKGQVQALKGQNGELLARLSGGAGMKKGKE